MAAKRPRTFYEVLRESSGGERIPPPEGNWRVPARAPTPAEHEEESSPSDGPAEAPAPRLSVADAVPGRSPWRGGIELLSRVPVVWRAVAGIAVALIVVVALVSLAMSLLDGGGSTEPSEASVEAVAAGEAEPGVLDRTGEGRIRRGLHRWVEGGEGDALEDGAAVGVSDEGPGPSQPAPQPSEPEINEKISGPYQVRIFMVKASREAQLEEARAFLRQQGVATEVEPRRGFLFLYTKQRFPSQDHPAAEGLLKRIKELGDAFARQSGVGTNEFKSAYIAKRESGA